MLEAKNGDDKRVGLHLWLSSHSSLFKKLFFGISLPDRPSYEII